MIIVCSVALQTAVMRKEGRLQISGPNINIPKKQLRAQWPAILQRLAPQDVTAHIFVDSADSYIACAAKIILTKAKVRHICLYTAARFWLHVCIQQALQHFVWSLQPADADSCLSSSKPITCCSKIIARQDKLPRIAASEQCFNCLLARCVVRVRPAG
jgi:hypothetical protein